MAADRCSASCSILNTVLNWNIKWYLPPTFWFTLANIGRSPTGHATIVYIDKTTKIAKNLSSIPFYLPSLFDDPEWPLALDLRPTSGKAKSLRYGPNNLIKCRVRTCVRAHTTLNRQPPRRFWHISAYSAAVGSLDQLRSLPNNMAMSPDKFRSLFTTKRS